MKEINFFDSSFIDRLAEKRKDKTWLSQQLETTNPRIVPIWQELVLTSTQPNQEKEASSYAVFLSYKEFQTLHPGVVPEILLGRDSHDQSLYFAHELPANDSSIPQTYSHLGEFLNIRTVSATMEHHQGALLAYARGMIYWHNTHLFCGHCGHPTRIEDAGHVRRCSNETCNRPHFPRTDPAVIVLISDETNEHCLLGRAPRWTENVYSTIAGFVEPGESLEVAVAREVLEETGVRVNPQRVRFHSSQPWPFPASIMLGFSVITHHQDVHFDKHELEDARWFTRQDIHDGLAEGSFRLPSRYSIAHRLIEDWRNSKLL